SRPEPPLPLGRRNRAVSSRRHLPLPLGSGTLVFSPRPELPLPPGRGTLALSSRPELPLPSGRGSAVERSAFFPPLTRFFNDFRIFALTSPLNKNGANPIGLAP